MNSLKAFRCSYICAKMKHFMCEMIAWSFRLLIIKRYDGNARCSKFFSREPSCLLKTFRNTFNLNKKHRFLPFVTISSAVLVEITFQIVHWPLCSIEPFQKSIPIVFCINAATTPTPNAIPLSDVYDHGCVAFIMSERKVR